VGAVQRERLPLRNPGRCQGLTARFGSMARALARMANAVRSRSNRSCWVADPRELVVCSRPLPAATFQDPFEFPGPLVFRKAGPVGLAGLRGRRLVSPPYHWRSPRHNLGALSATNLPCCSSILSARALAVGEGPLRLGICEELVSGQPPEQCPADPLVTESIPAAGTWHTRAVLCPQVTTARKESSAAKFSPANLSAAAQVVLEQTSPIRWRLYQLPRQHCPLPFAGCLIKRRWTPCCRLHRGIFLVR